MNTTLPAMMLTDKSGADAATDTGKQKAALASSQGLFFSVPTEDIAVFSSLGERVRGIVHDRLTMMEFIARARVKESGIAEVSASCGVAFATLRRWWFGFKREGWRALVPCNHEGCKRDSLYDTRVEKPGTKISEPFKQWFIALAESNQRKTAPAYRQFKRMWKSGAIIPVGPDGKCSDEKFNALPRHELPEGCTYSNLQRYCKDKFALKAMRVGLGAAMAKHGPKTFTSRFGLWPMSHIMIDDLWHDNFVTCRGELGRVLEFDALEILSGDLIGWGTKFRWRRDEDGKMDGLKEKFMRMIIAQIFFQKGFSPRGTFILAEHGTAAVPDWLKKLLFDRSGGLIRVRESGMTGKEQAVMGMYLGRGGGNPRFKSALESLRNLKHNELGFVPGQTGKDVEHRPEQLHGELRHNSDLLKAVAVLSEKNPDRAALIQLSLMQYHSQFLPLLGSIYDAICNREDHNLEGWHKCGFVVPQLNDAGSWVSAESLLPEKRDALMTLARVDKKYCRDHRLSPREVSSRYTGLLKLPPFVIAEILGNDFAREEKCENSYFLFQDTEIDPDPLRFESRIITPDGSERELASDRYHVIINPFDLSQLFVHDAKGRHLGIALRTIITSKADDDGLKRQFGHNNKRLADLLKPVRARHAGITREANKRTAANIAAIEAGGFVPPSTGDQQPATEVADCTQEILERSDEPTQLEEWS